ncbi:MAG TPA: AMP-binding protein [Acidimicrobiales bacterium]|nr:AMP-binding protein [Acidimicrobiales bacterium]
MEGRAQRGHYKIFLGMAAGVGKTYRMLQEGHAEADGGRDVAIGYLEPHKRRETTEQARGLEVVPRRSVPYRDVTVEEMDLPALLVRRPELALIDELAHTNPSGLEHEKRYEDVRDVLAAGIDVFSTVNVQHLESLNDQVAELTGTRVRETIPDAVLGEADIAGPASDDPGGAAPPAAEVGDDDGALVLFTSGTTGLPKPIVISHGVVAERLRFYAAPIDPDGPQAVDMMSAPIFHIGGTLGLLVSLHAGRKVVALPRFDAGAWLRAVEEHRVSQTFMVPTMLQRILDHPDFASRDLGSLVQLSYGAAAAPVPLVERALDALPHVGFLNVFGQTETLGAYAALGADDHRARRKLGSAGKAFPGVELRIVDPATATDRPVGEVGEVWVRSAQNVTADWLRTGDLAALDDEGYLHPVGRMTDTINRGGEKFGPVEVEEALCSHPAVRDAGVVGVPDAELGQRVGAVVVLDGRAGGVVSPGADELRTHAARRLARYKLPDWIVFADDLPYSATGKVSRKALAATILAARDANDADDHEAT